MNLGYAYPDGEYDKILFTALVLHPLHIVAAFYYNLQFFGFMSIMLYVTSLVFWKRPNMNSSARIFDMVIARFCILCIIGLSLLTNNPWLTTTPILIGIAFYFVSVYYVEQKKYSRASYFHCLLHIFVSIGAILTYREYYYTTHPPIQSSETSSE